MLKFGFFGRLLKKVYVEKTIELIFLVVRAKNL